MEENIPTLECSNHNFLGNSGMDESKQNTDVDHELLF